MNATDAVRVHEVGAGAACVGLILSALSGCASSSNSSHSSDRPGVITGQAPICYGPGPNLNLNLQTTIRATPKFGGASITVNVRTTNAKHSYRMTLPAGSYTISTYSGGVSAVVRAGQTLTGVDLPQPGCL